MIGIIDYGMGNIHSVQKAIENLGAKTCVSNNPKEINSCEKIVLPGVGAFDDAITELKKQDLIAVIKESVSSKKPFLGICLGMQLLFEKSQEGKFSGLGLLKGSVKKFKAQTDLKVPHMGWNQLKVTKSHGHKDTSISLLKGIEDNSCVYFCHSYYADPADKKVNAATTDYGIEFSAVVCSDNIYGVQFHPEKSQKTGLKILKNFIEL